MLNIEQTIQQKYLSFEHQNSWVTKPTLSLLRRLTHEQEINQFLNTHQDLQGFDLIDQVLVDYFNFNYALSKHESKVCL